VCVCVLAYRHHYHPYCLYQYCAQATYYGVLAAGHEELIHAYFKPLLSYRKWARVWAQQLFGCSGLAFPTGIAPLGNPTDGGGWRDNGQRSDGLFAALHFSSTWWYLRPPMTGTGDDDGSSSSSGGGDHESHYGGVRSEAAAAPHGAHRAASGVVGSTRGAAAVAGLGEQLLEYTSETMDFWLDYLVKHDYNSNDDADAGPIDDSDDDVGRRLPTSSTPPADSYEYRVSIDYYVLKNGCAPD
jgi:hypothetical protein